MTRYPTPGYCRAGGLEVSSERVELAGGRLAVVLAGADTAQEMARLELPLAVVRRAELTPGPDPTLYLYGAAVCQAAEQSLALLAGLTSWSLLDPGPPRLRVACCTPVHCALYCGQVSLVGLEPGELQQVGPSLSVPLPCTV